MSLILRNNAPTRTWNPWASFEEDVNRFFGTAPENRGGWAPAVDVHETEDAYEIAVDLPGMKREEIEISAKDNAVTIRGERKREHEASEGKYSRFERRYGSFERTFTVRDGFDTEKVTARYQDGVLNLTLPKREEAKPRQIEVKVQ